MKFEKYKSRLQAGNTLAEYIVKNNLEFSRILKKDPDNFFVFAIPNGGIPVAEGFCEKFNLIYDIIIVRKLKIPFNREAGFGAMTTDGTVLMNEPLLNSLNLSTSQINNSIEITKNEIKDRIKFYNKSSNLKKIYQKYIPHKYIFLIDDGLASGFTMLAAIQMVKKYNPIHIYVAVPTAPLRTVKKVKKEVNALFCPNIRNTMWFAVADAYLNWYDVPESEVIEILKKSQYYVNNIK